MADSDDIRLNVAAVSRASRVNGPGLRAVVWVQGCTIGCPGCFNPETHAHAARRLRDPSELAREVVAEPGLDGVTLSGGEPFEQALASARFAEEVQATGLTLMVFTGYPMDLLAGSEHADVRRLLRAIDLIVAGPYVRSRSIAAVGWRASSNQVLHALTERGRLALARHVSEEPCVEASSDGRGVVWSGFPDAGDIRWLESTAASERR